MFSPIQLYWREPEQDCDLSCLLKCHYDGWLAHPHIYFMTFLLAQTHPYDVYHISNILILTFLLAVLYCISEFLSLLYTLSYIVFADSIL